MNPAGVTKKQRSTKVERCCYVETDSSSLESPFLHNNSSPPPPARALRSSAVVIAPKSGTRERISAKRHPAGAKRQPAFIPVLSGTKSTDSVPAASLLVLPGTKSADSVPAASLLVLPGTKSADSVPAQHY
ncbi:MAG: hypothetical protein IJ578_02950, partial [Bacteroidales bacterium]|nr:hypothetical protein [Bacteroidales bacterium]